MTYLLSAFVFLVILGAVARAGTLAHTFSLMIDFFWSGFIWNEPIPVTISSRAGLAARNGKTLGAGLICFIFRNPRHCEEAIASDIARAEAALKLLHGG